MDYMTYQRKCIKCGVQYEDENDEDYYCSLCFEEKKRIAQEIDERMGSRPQEKHISELERYDSLPKKGGFVDARFF